MAAGVTTLMTAGRVLPPEDAAPDLRLPDKLCHYVIADDVIRDIRTGRDVSPQRDGYQYATDWFANKVREVQTYFNRNEEARRHVPSPMMVVVEAVFSQLIAEGRVMGGFAI